MRRLEILCSSMRSRRAELKTSAWKIKSRRIEMNYGGRKLIQIHNDLLTKPRETQSWVNWIGREIEHFFLSRNNCYS